jgi:hypothetical protein
MNLYKQSTRIGWRVGIISTVIASLFALSVLIAHPDGILGFAHIGTQYSLGIPKSEGGTTGYDGQFAYFIARDGAGAEPYMDGASLRYQRILYPLLARALSLGRAEIVPYMLVIINVLALGIGAGALAYLISYFGGNGYLALGYTLWVGNIFALRFDLHEILAFTFGLVAIIFYIRQQYIRAIALLIFATMTKEIGFLVAIGLGLHATFERRKWRWASLIIGAPLLTFLLWWLFMRLWFGTLPTRYPSAKLHLIPLQGMFDTLTATYEITGAARVVNFSLLLIFLGIPTVLLAVLWMRTGYEVYRRRLVYHAPIADNEMLPLWILLPCIGFVLTMPDVSWRDPAAAYRVAVPIVIGGMIFVARYYPKKLKWLVAWWLPASMILLTLPQVWTGRA